MKRPRCCSLVRSNTKSMASKIVVLPEEFGPTTAAMVPPLSHTAPSRHRTFRLKTLKSLSSRQTRRASEAPSPNVTVAGVADSTCEPSRRALASTRGAATSASPASPQSSAIASAPSTAAVPPRGRRSSPENESVLPSMPASSLGRPATPEGGKASRASPAFSAGMAVTTRRRRREESIAPRSLQPSPSLGKWASPRNRLSRPRATPPLASSIFATSEAGSALGAETAEAFAVGAPRASTPAGASLLLAAAWGGRRTSFTAPMQGSSNS
mmetsp:Transcript_55864/g.155761  ORF Transcript_55864/g.155761 Transcript_55864/m.155761 type:complete len:269 (+) Transcript_55864:1045-1851(+)